MLTQALLLCCVLALPGQDDPRDAVQSEHWVRAVALGAGLGEPAQGWQERFLGMDALGRREPGQLTPAEVERVREGARDAQPNVRAAALRAHARHGLVLTPGAMDAGSMSLPDVRLQLARALGAADSTSGLERLAKLVLDEDEDVAQEAMAQLFSAGSLGLTQQVEFLRRHWNTLEPARYLHLLDVLDTSNDCDSLVRVMADWLVNQPVSGKPAPDLQARRALWLSLRGAPMDERTVTWLADAWARPLHGAAGRTVESARRERLENVRLKEPFRSQLVGLLLQRAQDSDALIELPSDSEETLLSGAVAVHFAWRPSGVSAPFPIRTEWLDTFQVSAWEACFGRAQRWGEVADRALLCENDSVRGAAWATLSETWGRTGRVPSRSWLTHALEDEFLAEEVYRDLLHSQRDLGDLGPYFDWWSQQPVALQLNLLRDHGSTRAYTLWRAPLLELWSVGRGQDAVVFDVLASLEGDVDLEAKLLAGLRKELVLLESEAVPDEDRLRGAWREAESRARRILKAWMGVQGAGHASERLEVLLRVGELGKELAKLLVPELARTPAGRAALQRALASEKLSPRVRYEILIEHPGPLSERELDELWLAYANCDDDLQLRILERAAGVQGPLPLALLKDVAGDAGNGVAHRFQAIRSLLAGPREPREIAEDLTALLATVGDYEVKQVLVRALGTCSADLAHSGLLELYQDAFERSLIGDDLLASLVKIDLRKPGGQMLSAEAQRLWRLQPESLAADELRVRFDGGSLPARNFIYDGWLRAALALAKAGALEEALGETWWTWDGRLLMRLSEVLTRSMDQAPPLLVERLERAALVALAGEGSSSERLGLMLRLRARLLGRALDRGAWRQGLLQVQSILDDWRSGQLPTSAVERIFGHMDSDQGSDPRSLLLAIELECQIRSALSEGAVDRVDELRPQAERRALEPAGFGGQRLQVLLDEMK